MEKTKKKKNIANIIFITLICTLLVAYAMTIVFTLGWGLLTSLKSRNDYMLLNNRLGFPSFKYSEKEFFHLINYQLVIDSFEFEKTARFYSGGVLVKHEAQINIWVLILNTVVYAGAGCFLHAIVPCFVAYLCVKYPFKLSGVVYSGCLIIMMIPIVGGSTSEIAVLRSIGLYDTWFGYFIQKFNFTGMYFFVFYAFFQGVPNSYTEAAEVDGASQGMIFLRVILPLTVKMLGTIMLLNFVQLWNDYQVPLLYLPTHPTLAYGVYYMVGGATSGGGTLSELPIRVAGCMLLALPILVAFIFLKNKLMGNVSLGGLKE
ncbi:MAG: carbohydrate ABC transporter permease [Clostridia bacterium]|nr:carbohydrate ABC transporter permease [Clostridia bacterium]MBQ8658964.1 carbohydrate ABC transporter permease [Clostridia bacterium]